MTIFICRQCNSAHPMGKLFNRCSVCGLNNGLNDFLIKLETSLNRYVIKKKKKLQIKREKLEKSHSDVIKIFFNPLFAEIWKGVNNGR